MQLHFEVVKRKSGSGGVVEVPVQEAEHRLICSGAAQEQGRRVPGEMLRRMVSWGLSIKRGRPVATEFQFRCWGAVVSYSHKLRKDENKWIADSLSWERSSKG